MPMYHNLMSSSYPKLNRVIVSFWLGALCDSVSGELTLNKQADVAAAMGIATTLLCFMPAAQAAAKHQHAAMGLNLQSHLQDPH